LFCFGWLEASEKERIRGKSKEEEKSPEEKLPFYIRFSAFFIGIINVLSWGNCIVNPVPPAICYEQITHLIDPMWQYCLLPSYRARIQKTRKVTYNASIDVLSDTIKRKTMKTRGDLYLPLLDADIDLSNAPSSNEDCQQTGEDGERLAKGIHHGVVVGNL
jgi:hypothetical protein